MYKVGIIGLGQIAYHIDKDPNRKIIWSHIKAYEKIESRILFPFVMLTKA